MDKKVLMQDLAGGLASRRGLPEKDAAVFVRSVFEIIGEYLQTDKIVKVKGLGTFKLVTVDSRESVDVNTGERIVIKEYTKVNFTPDPVLRDAVNKPFAQFETIVLYEGTDITDMERMDIPDLSEDNETETLSDMNEEVEETDEKVSSESEKAFPYEENGIWEKGRHDIDEASIETASIDEAESIEIQDGKSGNAEEEITVDSTEGHSDIIDKEVENKTEVVSESMEKKSGVSADGEVEDGSVSSLPQNTENGNKAEPVSTVREDMLPKGKEEERHKENNADVPRVEKAHVATQRIEVQNVGHQTVENQHIVQVLPEHQNRRRVYLTPWMMFFAVLLVLLLMSVCYYIGYHHLFGKPG